MLDKAKESAAQRERVARRQRMRRLGARLSYWIVVALAIVVTAPWTFLDFDRAHRRSEPAVRRVPALAPAPATPTPPPIRVVEIDDNSIAKLGRWPWPRARLGEMIEKITGAGAAVVALDILLYDPGDPEDDAKLAKAMEGRPVVLGQFFTNDGGAPTLPDKAGFAYAGDDPSQFAYRLPRRDDAAARIRASRRGHRLSQLAAGQRPCRAPRAAGALGRRKIDAELRHGGAAGRAGRVDLHDQILERERRIRLRRPHRHGGHSERRRHHTRAARAAIFASISPARIRASASPPGSCSRPAPISPPSPAPSC